MGTSETIAAIVGVVLVLGVLAVFVLTRKHPENADRHDVDDRGTDSDATGRGKLPGDVAERPAGPDAEGQNVDGPGDIETGQPGPSA